MKIKFIVVWGKWVLQFVLIIKFGIEVLEIYFFLFVILYRLFMGKD